MSASRTSHGSATVKAFEGEADHRREAVDEQMSGFGGGVARQVAHTTSKSLH